MTTPATTLATTTIAGTTTRRYVAFCRATLRHTHPATTVQQQQHEAKHKHNLVNTQRYASMSLVQVWLSSLIEFHTQNGVSKWPGRLARWSATPPSLSSLLSRGSLSHVYTPHGIWLQLGVVHGSRMSKLLRSLSFNPGGNRRTTDDGRGTRNGTANNTSFNADSSCVFVFYLSMGFPSVNLICVLDTKKWAKLTSDC